MYQFKYHRPGSVDAAVGLYRSSEDAMYLAGGQTLIPTLKLHLAAPTDVIDLAGIDGMEGIEADNGTIHIGALTRHDRVASSTLVRERLPALAFLAGMIGDVQVRNLGTIGGAVANSDPAADYPAAVIGLGGSVRTTDRSIAADDYFEDLFVTALQPGELITGIDFPVARRAAYRKFPNPASRYAVVGVFVADFAGTIRVGVTGAGPCACRATSIEEALNDHLDPAALDEIEVPEAGLNSDLHASPAYRAHLVKIMAKRAVADLLR